MFLHDLSCKDFIKMSSFQLVAEGQAKHLWYSLIINTNLSLTKILKTWVSLRFASFSWMYSRINRTNEKANPGISQWPAFCRARLGARQLRKADL